MSILFIVPRASVWNPASGTGARFLAAAAAYGQRVGLDPGLPLESDEVIVDVERFDPFAQRLLEDYAAAAGGQREQLGELLGPAVVILDRAGRNVLATTTEQQAAVQWARRAFGAIPN